MHVYYCNVDHVKKIIPLSFYCYNSKTFFFVYFIVIKMHIKHFRISLCVFGKTFTWKAQTVLRTEFKLILPSLLFLSQQSMEFKRRTQVLINLCK